MIRTLEYNGILYQSGLLRQPRTRRESKRILLSDSRVTSILISQRFYKKFFEGKENYNAIIKHLIEESSSTLIFGTKIGKKTTVAKQYQSTGLELRKISCRIEEHLLVELEVIAQFFRISRCLLLQLMMELKDVGWLKLIRRKGIVRDATYPKQISFSLAIYPKNLPYPIYKSEIIEIFDH